MTDKSNNRPEGIDEEEECLQSRREFLISLGKWSQAVIGGAILGTGLIAADRQAEAGWINHRGGVGGSWINGGGGWVNRGASGWFNGGSGWVNRAVGGSWINNRGGGGWINNRGRGGWVNYR